MKKTPSSHFIDSIAINCFRYFTLSFVSIALVLFGLYSTGLLETDITPQEVATSWTLSSEAYLTHNHLPSQSFWFTRTTGGYGLTNIALSLLPLTTFFTFFILGIAWFRHKDPTYGSIAFSFCFILLLSIVGFPLPF